MKQFCYWGNKFELWAQYGWLDVSCLLNQDGNSTEALITKRMYSTVLSSNAVTLLLAIFLNLSGCAVPVFQPQSHHYSRFLGKREQRTSWFYNRSVGREPPQGWKSQALNRGGWWWQTPSRGRASLQFGGIVPKKKDRQK